MSLLDQYRVLDLSDERGLLAGRMLADLGADVVQVEPPGGSTARLAAPLSADGSYFWDTFAANKRGIVADLATADGRHLVRRLALRADFLIESAGPGVLSALGLGWPDLREVNPALIYGTVTAFGHDGPKSGYAESDLVVWAAGGPLQPNRDEGRPPLRMSVEHAFLNAAADLAGGLLIAHHARVRSGQGPAGRRLAQASLGLNTLARVLADSVRDPNPEWAAIVSPTKRVDQSGSGTGTSSQPEEMALPRRAGRISPRDGRGRRRLHQQLLPLAARRGRLLGPGRGLGLAGAAGPGRGGRVHRGRHDRGADRRGGLPRPRTKAEILDAAIRYRLLCIGISDTADLAASDAARGARLLRHRRRGRARRTMPARWASGSIPLADLRAAGAASRRAHRPRCWPTGWATTASGWATTARWPGLTEPPRGAADGSRR